MAGHKNSKSYPAGGTGMSPAAESLTQLPLHLTAILCLLALQDDLSRTALLDGLNQLEISPASHRRMKPDEMAEALKVLAARGWLQAADNRWRLTPGRENAVYLYMVTHPSAWGGDRSRPGYILRSEKSRLWYALLAGDGGALHLAEVMTHPGWSPRAHPAFLLLADGDGRQAFSLLGADIQTTLLAGFLEEACYSLSDCTIQYHHACTFSDAQGTTPPALREPLALQALWRDDAERLRRIAGEGELPPAVTGWAALCRGDTEAALEAYSLLVSRYRKTTRKRKLHLPPLPAMMSALTLLARHQPEHTPVLRELAHHAILIRQQNNR